MSSMQLETGLKPSW